MVLNPHFVSTRCSLVDLNFNFNHHNTRSQHKVLSLATPVFFFPVRRNKNINKGGALIFAQACFICTHPSCITSRSHPFIAEWRFSSICQFLAKTSSITLSNHTLFLRSKQGGRKTQTRIMVVGVIVATGGFLFHCEVTSTVLARNSKSLNVRTQPSSAGAKIRATQKDMSNSALNACLLCTSGR